MGSIDSVIAVTSLPLAESWPCHRAGSLPMHLLPHTGLSRAKTRQGSILYAVILSQPWRLWSFEIRDIANRTEVEVYCHDPGRAGSNAVYWEGQLKRREHKRVQGRIGRDLYTICGAVKIVVYNQSGQLFHVTAYL